MLVLPFFHPFFWIIYAQQLEAQAQNQNQNDVE
jgi:hypothetical protein